MSFLASARTFRLMISVGSVWVFGRWDWVLVNTHSPFIIQLCIILIYLKTVGNSSQVNESLFHWELNIKINFSLSLSHFPPLLPERRNPGCVFHTNTPTTWAVKTVWKQLCFSWWFSFPREVTCRYLEKTTFFWFWTSIHTFHLKFKDYIYIFFFSNTR